MLFKFSVLFLVHTQRCSRFTPDGAQGKVGLYAVLEIESGSAICKAFVTIHCALAHVPE